MDKEINTTVFVDDCKKKCPFLIFTSGTVMECKFPETSFVKSRYDKGRWHLTVRCGLLVRLSAVNWIAGGEE